MSEYYYFAASLPMLRMDKEPPISYSAFMAEAAKQLSRSDYSDLQHAVLEAGDGDVSLPIVREWQVFAGRLNAAICSVRAERLGFSGYAPDAADREMEAAAREIVDNPDYVPSLNDSYWKNIRYNLMNQIKIADRITTTDYQDFLVASKNQKTYLIVHPLLSQHKLEEYKKIIDRSDCEFISIITALKLGRLPI